MGIIASLIDDLFGSKDLRILMVGLDAAGKIGEVVTTIPTIGFNVEVLKYKNTSFTVWDIGGQTKIRRLWQHYYQGSQGVIFVVDSNDRERIQEAADELNMILREDSLRDSTVLVLANKQDMPNAMSVHEITQKLGLHEQRARQWHVQPTCATTGEGLYEGLSWLGMVTK